MNCAELKNKIEFKVSTEEMNQIVECVEARYKKRILELESDLSTYKMQVSNLLKEKSKNMVQ